MNVTSVTASPSVARRTLPGPTVAAVILFAAIAGLLLGGSLSGSDRPAPRPAAAPQSIAHDGLRVQVPNGWARADVASVPGFSHPLGLRNEGSGLRASVERLPATSATLLPAAYVKTLASAPDKPTVVGLASGTQAWRYRFPGRDGSMTLLYAAPTTSGIATVACTTPIDTSIPRACEALAGAVSLPGSRPLAPSTSAAFFSALPAAVKDLDAARAKGVDELKGATRAAAQALAADRLADAHKAAGAALTPVISAGDALPTATVGALTATATAYRVLASAARARSPKPYAEAGRTVSAADAGLRRTMTKVAAAASAASTAARAPVRTPATETKPAVQDTPAADTKPAMQDKPAAETSPAASEKPAVDTKPATQDKPAAHSGPAASEKPAPDTKPFEVTKPGADTKPAAKAQSPTVPVPVATTTKPAAQASQGFDVTVLILGVLGILALALAFREIRRAWVNAAEAQ